MLRNRIHISRSVVITEAKNALTAQSIGPETADFDVSLGDPSMGDEKPDAKDGLGKNVQNCICDDLPIDGKVTSTISKAPDTTTSQRCIIKEIMYLHRVCSPDDEGEACN